MAGGILNATIAQRNQRQPGALRLGLDPSGRALGRFEYGMNFRGCHVGSLSSNTC